MYAVSHDWRWREATPCVAQLRFSVLIIFFCSSSCCCCCCSSIQFWNYPVDYLKAHIRGEHRRVFRGTRLTLRCFGDTSRLRFRFAKAGAETSGRVRSKHKGELVARVRHSFVTSLRRLVIEHEQRRSASATRRGVSGCGAGIHRIRACRCRLG